MARETVDAVVVGAGHNGLAAAAYLARAGQEVVVLERDDAVGGAARSAEVFPGYGARLSKYSYLVSLLPQLIVDELGLDVELLGRTVGSYTPLDDGGILIDDDDPARTDADLGVDAAAWRTWYEATTAVAEIVFPTMTEPLVDADTMRRRIGARAWRAFVERPLAETLAARFRRDEVRGIVATDALIGTFTSTADESRLANRCFLYHVIGRGTGRWDVPAGGMGQVTAALLAAAVGAGAAVETGVAVTSIDTSQRRPVVRTADGRSITAGAVLANVAPAVLARLRGLAPSEPAPEGAQLKINMLLARLPGLRDEQVTPEQGFAGTFHVNEAESQLEAAYRQAASGAIPDVPPCEVYCHSLTDPSILSPELQQAGAHTLTLFGLHMPARLFRADPDGARAAAARATLASVDAVLAEPIEACLLDPSTIEVMSPLDVEALLAMPGGHIFHRDLQWPWAERPEDVGRWGVETDHPALFVCGAGARRGGGVSAIPGRAAAIAALQSVLH